MLAGTWGGGDAAPLIFYSEMDVDPNFDRQWGAVCEAFIKNEILEQLAPGYEAMIS